MQIKLLVVGGKANKDAVQVKLPATIGRSRECTLTVGHAKVSRRHCELYEQDGALVVRDAGSLNGTFVDDERVAESLLKPGARLTIGPLTFEARYEHNGEFPTLTSPTSANSADPDVSDMSSHDEEAAHESVAAKTGEDEPVVAGTTAADVDDADVDDAAPVENPAFDDDLDDDLDFDLFSDSESSAETAEASLPADIAPAQTPDPPRDQASPRDNGAAHDDEADDVDAAFDDFLKDLS